MFLRPDIFAETEMSTLHRRRCTLLLTRTSPDPLLLDRVPVFLVDADLSLLMDGDQKRSSGRATVRGTGPREPRESRESDGVMRRRPLYWRKRRRFTFDRWDPRWLQVNNAESRIDKSPARDGKGEQCNAVQRRERQP